MRRRSWYLTLKLGFEPLTSSLDVTPRWYPPRASALALIVSLTVTLANARACIHVTMSVYKFRSATFLVLFLKEAMKARVLPLEFRC